MVSPILANWIHPFGTIPDGDTVSRYTLSMSASDRLINVYEFWQRYMAFTAIIIEPQHDKTNKMTFAPSEDSDQPGHLLSLISLRYALNGLFLHAGSEDSDQTGRLIGVFAGHTDYSVVFVLLRLS